MGFYDGPVLLALLDLVKGYPNTAMAYIGIFVVNGAMGNRGLGTALMEELCGYLKSAGVSSVRLAYEKQNPQAARFWTKNGFCAIGEVEHTRRHMVIAERIL